MNKQRRKEIADARAKLEQAAELIEQAKAALEQARDDEQEYYDNMPESLQNSEKGETAQAAVSALESALDNLGDISQAIADCEEAEGA